jgi:hypothetical protein
MWSAVVDAVGGKVKIIVPVALQSSGIVDWIGGAQAAVPGIFQKVYGVAVHPYGNDTIDDGSEAQWHYGMSLGVAKLLPGVPQWWTETGQQVQASGQANQAKWATRVLQDLKAGTANVEAAFWYDGKDWQSTGSDVGWGLLDPLDNQRQAWAAWKAGAAAL